MTTPTNLVSAVPEDFPPPPEHPDYERLAAVVHALDDTAKALPDPDDGEDAADDAFGDFLGRHVDPESISCIAAQRSWAVVSVSPLPDGGDLMALYIDGFLTGLRFAEAGGRQ